MPNARQAMKTFYQREQLPEHEITVWIDWVTLFGAAPFQIFWAHNAASVSPITSSTAAAPMKGECESRLVFGHRPRAAFGLRLRRYRHAGGADSLSEARKSAWRKGRICTTLYHYPIASCSKKTSTNSELPASVGRTSLPTPRRSPRNL